MKSSCQFGTGFRQAIVLTCASVSLSGCVAAAPAIMMAASGIAVATSVYGGYKVYQSVSGGEIGVEFEDEHIHPSAQSAMRDADVLAFWVSPDRSLVEAAQIAETELSFDQIISPATTGARIRQTDIPTELAQMTRREQDEAFARAADILDADLIVGVVKLGVEHETNMLSLQRATLTQNYRVILYSPTYGQLWTSDLGAVARLGGSLPSDNEAQAIVGRAIIDRLKDIASGNTDRERNAALTAPLSCVQDVVGQCVR
jgi:hypothetical protein